MSTPTADRSSRRLHVLLAEDGLMHQKWALRLLEDQGHRVTVVSNGRKVLDILNGRQHFDVVLMDVEMPQLDGLAATRRIRNLEDPELRCLPIIAVTSSENPEECLAAGMDAYLSKPLQAAMLRRMLQRVVAPSAA